MSEVDGEVGIGLENELAPMPVSESVDLSPPSPESSEPPSKKPKSDGSLERVDKRVLMAAQNVDEWIASRKRNWPTRARVAAKLALAEKAPPPEKSQTQTQVQPQSQQPQAPRRRICKFFSRGHCVHGSLCRFSHEMPSKASPQLAEKVYKRYEAPPKAPLFLRLAQTDMDAEDYNILKFVCYLYTNGLLEEAPQP